MVSQAPRNRQAAWGEASGPRPEQRSRRSFGKIRRIGSGRFQGSYVGPDGARYNAPETYSAREDAEGWLRDERRLIEWGEWSPPESRLNGAPDSAQQDIVESARANAPFGDYARAWVQNRVTSKGTPLHPRTRAEYLRYIEGPLEPFVNLALGDITAAHVARWHAAHASTPSHRHKVYNFMQSVLRTAVEVDELIDRTPCRVGNATRKPKRQSSPEKVVRAVTHDTIRQLADLVQPRDRVLVLLLAYCCLRSGEACALRRRDVQLGITQASGIPFGWLTVERAISSYNGQRHEGETKTGAKGERLVPIPPHIIGDLIDHLDSWAEPGPEGLLFPSTNPAIDFRTTQQINGHAAVRREDGTVRKRGYGWYHARQVAGVPTMHLHWLRHWASTVWDEAGTPDGVRRAIMGHAQPGMTGLYTHPDTAKASPYAVRVSELAGWSANPPARTSPETSRVDPLVSVLATLEPRVLGEVLASMSTEQVSELLPQLPPQHVAAALAALKRPTGQ